MAMYGCVWLCRAMYDYVGLCTLLVVTNGEPLYDTYTTYLPQKGMGEEKLKFRLWKSVKRQKAPVGRDVPINFFADCSLCAHFNGSLYTRA